MPSTAGHTSRKGRGTHRPEDKSRESTSEESGRVPLIKGLRERVIKEAHRVFAKKGYSKATLDEICLRADVAKGTLYLHFKDKEDLFIESIVTSIERKRENIERIIVSIGDPFEQLRVALWEHLQGLLNRREEEFLLSKDMVNILSANMLRVRAAQAKYYSLFEEILLSMQRSGLLKKEDLRVVTFAVLAPLSSYAFHCKICNFRLMPVKEFFDKCLNFLLADKLPKEYRSRIRGGLTNRD